MQPVKTTALSASEAVRSLNAANNREAGGMVMFRTDIGLKKVWSQSSFVPLSYLVR